jgi:deoxycytidylate deaminase
MNEAYTYTPSKGTQKCIDLAERLANQSTFPSFRHGAVLVKGSTVVNASCNKGGFNSFGARFRKKEYGSATLHAELGAILNVERSNTEGATIYVVRVNKRGQQRLSKPCHMCESAMKYCGIKRVVYSTNGGYEVMKL